VLTGRNEKFPEGESLKDLEHRATEAVAECILSHLHEDGAHIAIASHGLCISELVAAVIRLDPELKKRTTSYTGLLNTAWTRVQLTPRVSHYPIENLYRMLIALKETLSGPVNPSKPPSVKVVVTDVNQSGHLASIVRSFS
jgi:broad specificity phosphatase PhoE